MKALIIKKYLKDHCRGSILSYFFRLSFPSLAMKAGCDDGSPMNKATARKITNIVIEAFALDRRKMALGARHSKL